jgi:hypothetical protein
MPHVRFSRVTSRADVEEKDDCEARVGDDVGTTISSDDVYPWRHNSIDEVKRDGASGSVSLTGCLKP